MCVEIVVVAFYFLPMTLLKGSSSQYAQAQNWPGINQQVRFATMANESNANRDRLFEIVRDGSYAEAKKVLSDADMTWQHSALRQNFLFFIAARRRRGSEMLAKQCVGMGVNLEEVDVYGQTPLFWAAARGNMLVVQFLRRAYFFTPFFFFFCSLFFFSVPLVPWSFGPWSSGPVVLWSRGPLVPWSLGLLGPLVRCSPLVPWSSQVI